MGPNHVYLHPSVDPWPWEWEIFKLLPKEQQIAIRLRWGNDLVSWYRKEMEIPDRESLEKAGADKDLLELVDAVRAIREEEDEVIGRAQQRTP
jgi:hypothetical protein